MLQITAGRHEDHAREILGDTTAVITSDRWWVYNHLPLRRRQVCWLQLRRDFQNQPEGLESEKAFGELGLETCHELFKRGTGTTAGLIMAALGDRPAAKITPAEAEPLLRTVAATGVSARSVHQAPEIVCAAFNCGMKPTTYSLPTNPARRTDRRRVPEPGVLLFYSLEDIEGIARSLETGFHRPAVAGRGELELELFEDHRDGEAIRIAAYSGLRLGELLALGWRNVDWTGSALTISRSPSSGVEGTTKTGHVPARASGRPGRGRARSVPNGDIEERGVLKECDVPGSGS